MNIFNLHVIKIRLDISVSRIEEERRETEISSLILIRLWTFYYINKAADIFFNMFNVK